MRCPRCGRDNVNGSNFCIYCHSLLTTPDSNRMPKQACEKGKTKDSLSTTFVVAIGVLAIILVILVAVLLIFGLSSSKGSGRSGFGGGGAGGYVSTSSSSAGQSTYAKSLTLSVSDNDIATNSAGKVCFYADAGVEGATVDLYDSNGNEVAHMYDDGNDDISGDMVAGDGVYTTLYEFDTSLASAYYFYAQTTDKSKKSNEVKLTVITPLTYDERAQMRTVDEGFERLRNNKQYAYMTTEERAKAALELLDDFASEGLVDSDTILVDSRNGLVTYYYSCGVMGGEVISGIDASNSSFENGVTGTLPMMNPLRSENSFEGDAAFLYATDGLKSPRYPVVQTLVEDWSSRGLETSLDSNVTIDDFKKLSGYDFVCVDAHGTYCAFTYNADMTNLWYGGLEKYENKDEIVVPVVFSLEETSFAKDSLYAEDLKAGRVVKIGGHYGILPSFFDKYYDYDDISDSIFYFTSCQFMGAFGNRSEEWTDVLLSKNVDAFIGYHNSVYAGYVYDKLSSFVPDLINGASVKQALDNAKHLYGNDDGQWYRGKGIGYDSHTDVAYSQIRGDNNATLGDLVYKGEYAESFKSTGIDFGDAFYHALAETYNKSK